MKEFDFEQLKNIDIEFPESWVENVLNSPEEKRKYAVPNRFFYAAASAAACVIIAAAVTLSLLFGIGGNVDLIDPNPISNPSQADDISGGTVPSTLSDSGLPSGIPPLMIGGDNQSSIYESKAHRREAEEYHKGWITEYLKSKNPRNKALWTKKELNARRNTFDPTRLFLRREVPWQDEWDSIVDRK